MLNHFVRANELCSKSSLTRNLRAYPSHPAVAKLGLPPSTNPATVRLLTSTRAFLRKHRLHKASHAALRAGAHVRLRRRVGDLSLHFTINNHIK